MYFGWIAFIPFSILADVFVDTSSDGYRLVLAIKIKFLLPPAYLIFIEKSNFSLRKIQLTSYFSCLRYYFLCHFFRHICNFILIIYMLDFSSLMHLLCCFSVHFFKLNELEDYALTVESIDFSSFQLISFRLVAVMWVVFLLFLSG